MPWGAGSGAAVVGSATVSTGFGPRANQVTLDASGALRLNGSSSLSYGEGSYTVSSRNGKVTNTLTPVDNPNGDYLNISSSVDGVQTVGWLQNQA